MSCLRLILSESLKYLMDSPGKYSTKKTSPGQRPSSELETVVGKSPESSP